MLLLKNGEERLLVAVEGCRVPLNVAITIAGASSDEAVQAALQDAYESGKLRGGQLMQVRRVLIEPLSVGKAVCQDHRPAHPGTQGMYVQRNRLILLCIELYSGKTNFGHFKG
ncbi:MAG: hypothetical protein LBK55_02365 [Azoarcus sp.]|jgi:ParB family chromosome partitioning protein|nr:hypothetical protein [Azoarcus sp.]